MILAPGAVIGVLGGGQLGRMLALAAARLGFDAHIFAPEPESPAARVAARASVAAYTDLPALRAFARACDVVTFEFENVPAASVAALLEAGAPVRPGARALAVAQDRLAEKRFLLELGLPTAPHRPVESEADLPPALAEIGLPAILKAQRLGYDGKGQARIAEPGHAATAFAAIGGGPAILEAFVDFEREISIVAARGADGAFAPYGPCENWHEGGMLRRTRAPAAIPAALAEKATQAARAVAEALDYVGVLAVEFFVTKEGALITNEFAPRVHNSGHWTADACDAGQFEQHVRAVAGWPLGDPRARYAAEMENLIGADAERWPALAGEGQARVWLYGKGEARPGRKMGHVTRLEPMVSKTLKDDSGGL